eukprot:scaffold37426_cov61-Cyclotella_meneghiniana.AAC.5
MASNTREFEEFIEQVEFTVNQRVFKRTVGPTNDKPLLRIAVQIFVLQKKVNVMASIQQMQIIGHTIPSSLFKIQGAELISLTLQRTYILP